MGVYSKYVLPSLVHHTCRTKPSMRQRAKVVPLARGRVLEIVLRDRAIPAASSEPDQG